MISGATLLSTIVTLVIAGLIFWLLWWFINYIALPEPFNKVARVIIGLAAILFLISILLSLTGHQPLIKW